MSDRKRPHDAGRPSYVVPDTDEDVDEDTVQSWTIEGEDEAAEAVDTVDKVRTSFGEELSKKNFLSLTTYNNNCKMILMHKADFKILFCY